LSSYKKKNKKQRKQSESEGKKSEQLRTIESNKDFYGQILFFYRLCNNDNGNNGNVPIAVIRKYETFRTRVINSTDLVSASKQDYKVQTKGFDVVDFLEHVDLHDEKNIKNDINSIIHIPLNRVYPIPICIVPCWKENWRNSSNRSGNKDIDIKGSLPYLLANNKLRNEPDTTSSEKKNCYADLSITSKQVSFLTLIYLKPHNRCLLFQNIEKQPYDELTQNNCKLDED
jgi:hypothetical protein